MYSGDREGKRAGAGAGVYREEVCGWIGLEVRSSERDWAGACRECSGRKNEASMSETAGAGDEVQMKAWVGRG
jgi:hypothetical protein